MIEVSLSLIKRDVTRISPKICLHCDMRRTVIVLNNADLDNLKRPLILGDTVCKMYVLFSGHLVYT